MKVIDLFCGAGGSSTGMEQAGHEIVLAVDNDEYPLKAYAHNHPGTELWQEDITKLKAKELPKADIILGSTPCQSFSKANRYKNCDMSLTLTFLRLIRKYKPKYWILENIREVAKYMPSGFKSYVKMLNAAHYGTPQLRLRMIAGNYPHARVTHTKWPTATLDGPPTKRYVYMSDALPFLKGKWIADHRTTQPSAERSAFFTADRPSRTVTTKEFMIVPEPVRGVKKIRYLTPEEHAPLQGFPKNYKFHGPNYRRMRQIANAVPPPILKAIGTAINKKEGL